MPPLRMLVINPLGLGILLPTQNWVLWVVRKLGSDCWASGYTVVSTTKSSQIQTINFDIHGKKTKNLAFFLSFSASLLLIKENKLGGIFWKMEPRL